MLADSSPTHVMQWKLPWNLKFEILIKCVGRVKSCRSIASHLSWPVTDHLISIFRPHTFNPSLQAVKILARFYTFTNFFKNVPDYRNRSNFARGPFSTYSSIWDENILGSEKKSFFIFTPPGWRFILSCTQVMVPHGVKIFRQLWFIGFRPGESGKLFFSRVSVKKHKK